MTSPTLVELSKAVKLPFGRKAQLRAFKAGERQARTRAVVSPESAGISGKTSGRSFMDPTRSAPRGMRGGKRGRAYRAGYRSYSNSPEGQRQMATSIQRKRGF